MLEEVIHLAVLRKTLAKGPILVKNRRIGWGRLLDTVDPVNQGILGNGHPFMEEGPEFFLVPCCF